MVKRILLTWPELGLTAKATLADDKNPELCNDIWQALPFSSIMNTAVVSGGSMYCWAPLLSFAPLRYKEKINEAPVGRLRYTPGTGNKLVIQYDDCTEDTMGTVLGEVDAEDLDTLRTVGKQAQQALFLTKKKLFVRISKLGETESERSLSLAYPADMPEQARSLGQTILDAALAATEQEPQQLKDIRSGKKAGTLNQYFSLWEFTYGMLRDLSMYTLYSLAKLANDDNFSVEQLHKLAAEMIPGYSGFLGSCGLATLRDFCTQFLTLSADGTLRREDFRCLLHALCIYTNMLSSWAYFYYPWGIGSCYRVEENDAV